MTQPDTSRGSTGQRNPDPAHPDNDRCSGCRAARDDHALSGDVPLRAFVCRQFEPDDGSESE